LGTPKESNWPGVTSLPDYQPNFPNWPAVPMNEIVPNLDHFGLDLLLVNTWIFINFRKCLFTNHHVVSQQKKLYCILISVIFTINNKTKIIQEKSKKNKGLN
jgi:hypothetical protein